MAWTETISSSRRAQSQELSDTTRVSSSLVWNVLDALGSPVSAPRLLLTCWKLLSGQRFLTARLYLATDEILTTSAEIWQVLGRTTWDQGWVAESKCWKLCSDADYTIKGPLRFHFQGWGVFLSLNLTSFWAKRRVHVQYQLSHVFTLLVCCFKSLSVHFSKLHFIPMPPKSSKYLLWSNHKDGNFSNKAGVELIISVFKRY